MDFRIARASVHRLRSEVEREVVTAFGAMAAREAVLLVLEDDRGTRGIGESWVNFPSWASRERVAAFEQAYLPWLKGREVGDIPSFIEGMFAAFRGPAEQAGAVGPLMSALCAVECALWDVAARRADVPLHRLLFDNPRPEVEIYASGINAPLPVDLIDSHLSQGVRLFKLKLGFGDDADRANLDALAKHLAGRARLAVDANRNWTLAQAERWLDVLADFDVVWLEEPLRAGEEESLERLFNQNKVPVAAGENVMMTPGGDTRVLADFPAHVLQPDLTKYAPLHCAFRLLPSAAKAGKRVVPHFLGSAPGQAVSLHFASGCPASRPDGTRGPGGNALVEWDINRNPLRTELADPPFAIQGGKIRIPDAPGIGWTVRSEALK